MTNAGRLKLDTAIPLNDLLTVITKPNSLRAQYLQARWKVAQFFETRRCRKLGHTPFTKLWRPRGSSISITAENSEWHVRCVHCSAFKAEPYDPTDADGLKVNTDLTGAMLLG